MPDFCNIKLDIFSSLQDVSSSGLAEGEAENTESHCDGIMKRTADGSLFISYEESSENGKIYSDIKITDSKIAVRRRGAIESTLIFEDGVLHKSTYTLPPYTLDMEVFTKKIRRDMHFGKGELTLIYNMNVGGAARSCIMKITVSTA